MKTVLYAAAIFSLSGTVSIASDFNNNNNYGVVDPATGIRALEPLDTDLTRVIPNDGAIYLGKGSFHTLKKDLDAHFMQLKGNRRIEYKELRITLPETDLDHLHSWRAIHSLNPYGIMVYDETGAMTDAYDQKWHRILLKLKSFAQSDYDARNVNPYKLFEGELDPKLINRTTFYNLMTRVGFTKEDFMEDATGKQGRIFVRGIQLIKLNLEEAVKEANTEACRLMQTATEKYVVLVFSLPKGANYKVGDMRLEAEGKLRIAELGGAGLGIAIEPQENRFYVCLENTQRNVLDLHPFESKTKNDRKKLNGIRVGPAFDIVADFLTEKYLNFEKTTTVRTGRGKHVNANGTRGVLAAAFPGWIEDDKIKPMIQNIQKTNDDGNYIVTFKPIVRLDVSKEKNPEQLMDGLYVSLFSALEEGTQRLIIKSRLDQKDLMYQFILSNLRHIHIPGNFAYELGEYAKKGEWKLILGLQDESDTSDVAETDEALVEPTPMTAPKIEPTSLQKNDSNPSAKQSKAPAKEQKKPASNKTQKKQQAKPKQANPPKGKGPAVNKKAPGAKKPNGHKGGTSPAKSQTQQAKMDAKDEPKKKQQGKKK